MERLGEVVGVDTHCCGGAFQLFSATVGSTLDGRFRGSVVGRTLAAHAGGGGGTSRLGGGGGLGRGYATVGSDDGRGGSVSVSGSVSSGGSRENLAVGPRSSGAGGGHDKTPIFNILSHADDDD